MDYGALQAFISYTEQVFEITKGNTITSAIENGVNLARKGRNVVQGKVGFYDTLLSAVSSLSDGFLNVPRGQRAMIMKRLLDEASKSAT